MELRLALVVLLLLAAPVAAQPDIVVIVLDDVAYGDPAHAGNPHNLTPTLDALAAQGLRLTHFYAHPMCAMTRVSLHTGREPALDGVFVNLKGSGTNGGGSGLPTTWHLNPTLPRELQQAGYSTLHLGKKDLGAPSKQEIGYDGIYWPMLPLPPAPQQALNPFIFEVWERWWHRYPGPWSVAAPGPRFAVLSLRDIHTPYYPSSVDLSACAGVPSQPQRDYCAMMRRADRFVGEVRARLAAESDDALLVVFSDNGGLKDPASAAHFAGLRGAKLSLYEGGIRVPAYVERFNGPALLTGDLSTVTGAVDLMPTLLEAAGAPIPLGISGVSMWDHWTGGPAPPAPDRFFSGHAGLLDDEYEPWACRDPDTSPPLAMIAWPYKLLLYPDGQGRELYNLASDPGEQFPSAMGEAWMDSVLLDWWATASP